MAKDKLTKKEAATGAADMIYALGQGLGMGTRGPGRFVDLLGGTGLAVAGTNRQGVTGVLMGDKFVPTSKNYYKAPGGGNGNGNGNGNDDEDEEKKRNPYKIKDVSFSRRLPAGASWNRTMDTYFPDPNRKQDGNDEDDNNRGPINLEHGMKNGGLVRGAGKAQRGRGRGRMV